MSKLYDLYLKKKNENNNKYYLFKNGMFYIFIDDDARYVSNVTLLKLTNYGKDTVKCGFSESKLDNYLELFKNLDIDKITPVKALNILYELRGMLNE